MRIIAEEHHGHWTAWFETHPETAFGGDRAAVAVARLVESVGIDPGAVEAEYDAATLTHMEFRVPAGPCPDCKGTGRYVGLAATEPCQTCKGFGHV